MEAVDRKGGASRRPLPAALQFFLIWLRRPGGLGTFLPSSGPLARAMAREIDPDQPGLVVELGGGTGVVTEALLESGVAPKDLIVIEREPELHAILQARFPQLRVIRADARNLREILRAEGAGPVKAIASCLPLLNMPEAVRAEIFAQAFAVMAPPGCLLQFTFGPSSPLPRRMVQALGLDHWRASWIPLNLPPASVWRYQRAAAQVEAA